MRGGGALGGAGGGGGGLELRDDLLNPRADRDARFPFIDCASAFLADRVCLSNLVRVSFLLADFTCRDSFLEADTCFEYASARDLAESVAGVRGAFAAFAAFADFADFCF